MKLRSGIYIAILALGLGGCAQLQAVGTGLSLTTASVANPVTQIKEAQIELAMDSAVQVLLTYKRACVAGTADVNCKDNIRQIQAYTRQIKPMVAQLRNFVDTNDQVNAVVVYNQLTALYTNMKSAASSLGVSLGSAS
jgi:hypothetical protein